jgi:hypothetical protein
MAENVWSNQQEFGKRCAANLDHYKQKVARKQGCCFCWLSLDRMTVSISRRLLFAITLCFASQEPHHVSSCFWVAPRSSLIRNPQAEPSSIKSVSNIQSSIATWLMATWKMERKPDSSTAAQLFSQSTPPHTSHTAFEAKSFAPLKRNPIFIRGYPRLHINIPPEPSEHRTSSASQAPVVRWSLPSRTTSPDRVSNQWVSTYMDSARLGSGRPSMCTSQSFAEFCTK